ncbi:MAG: hypothetical protein JWN95_3021 [Frankiales bacterium]|nr:hypothetical protein [Frankiales bacterium]
MGDTSWFEGDNSPGAGDMGQVQALHSNLATVAEAAATAKTDLNGLKDKTDDAVWRGKSADEFKDKIGDVPNELDKLSNSYQKAADGFSAYISSVNGIKHSASSLASKIRGAQSTYEGAVLTMQNWISSHPGEASYSHGSIDAPAYGEGGCYTASHHPKPKTAPAAGATPPPADTGATFETVQGNVQSAWNAMQGLYNQMEDLRTHDRANADNAIVGKLKEAHDAGIKNESGWHKFFHALAEVAKWAGIIIAAIAIIAVLVLAFPEGLGLGLAILAITDTTTAIGATVIFGGAIASGIAFGSQLGEKFTSDGGEYSDPSWLSIGASAFGMIPGFGKAGELMSGLGPGAEAFASSLRGMADTIRLVPAVALDDLAGPLGSLGRKFVSPWLLGLGANIPVETKAGEIIWGGLKLNAVRKAIPIPGLPGGGGPSDGDVQGLITQLQSTDPSKAASAKQTAANLAKGDKGSYQYPKQYSYPQTVTP